MISRVMAETPTKGAARNSKSRNIQTDLRALGFKAMLFGTNTAILNRLSPELYQDVLTLLRLCREYAEKEYCVKNTQLLSLTLPWPRQLRSIDIKRLLANRPAMVELCKRFVMGDGSPEVELTKLPWLYQTYVISPPTGSS